LAALHPLAEFRYLALVVFIVFFQVELFIE
jgi:hypothetical protein